MSDFVAALRTDPDNALKRVKTSNMAVLRDIFFAVPEHERGGARLPERGFLIKQWLEDWGQRQQHRPPAATNGSGASLRASSSTGASGRPGAKVSPPGQDPFQTREKRDGFNGGRSASDTDYSYTSNRSESHQLRELQEELAVMREEQDITYEVNDSLREQLARAKAEHADCGGTITKLKRQLADALGTQGGQQADAHLQSEASRLAADNVQLTEAYDAMKRDLSSTVQDVVRLTEELATARQAADQTTRANDQTTHRMRSLEQQLSARSEQVVKLQMELTGAAGRSDKAEAAVAKLKKELHAALRVPTGDGKEEVERLTEQNEALREELTRVEAHILGQGLAVHERLSGPAPETKANMNKANHFLHNEITQLKGELAQARAETRMLRELVFTSGAGDETEADESVVGGDAAERESKELKRFKADLAQAIKDNAQLSGELARVQQTHALCSGSMSSVAEELAAAKKKLELSTSTLQHTSSAHDKVKAALKSAKAKLHKLESADQNATLEAVRAELEDERELREGLEADLEEAALSRQRSEARLEELRGQLAQVERESKAKSTALQQREAQQGHNANLALHLQKLQRANARLRADLEQCGGTPSLDVGTDDDEEAEGEDVLMSPVPRGRSPAAALRGSAASQPSPKAAVALMTQSNAARANAEMEAQIGALSAELIKARHTIAALESEAVSMSTSTSTNEERIDALTDELVKARYTIAALETEVTSTSESNLELTQQLNQLHRKYGEGAEGRDQVVDLQNRLASLEHEHSTFDSALQQERRGHEQHAQGLENQIRALQSALEHNKKAHHGSIRADANEATQYAEDLARDLQQAQEEIQQLRRSHAQEADDQRSKRNADAQSNAALKAEVSKLRTELSNAHAELQEVTRNVQRYDSNADASARANANAALKTEILELRTELSNARAELQETTQNAQQWDANNYVLQEQVRAPR